MGVRAASTFGFRSITLVCSRSRSLLLKIEIQFPLNNFSLLWPIDTKLAVCVAYIKTHLRIATQVSVIKVKVTVTKKKFSFRSVAY